MEQQPTRANEVAALANIVEEAQRSKPGDPDHIPAVPYLERNEEQERIAEEIVVTIETAPGRNRVAVENELTDLAKQYRDAQ